MAHERILIVEERLSRSWTFARCLWASVMNLWGLSAEGAVGSALALRPEVILMDIMLKGA